MLILFVAISLLFVYNAQCMLMAKAKVHADSSNVSVGYVMFTQKDANSPTIVKGRFWNMKPDTVHVSLKNSEFQTQSSALECEVF